MKPFFSIVIPTYNRAMMIRTCVDSVLRQTFSDFEILIVDDGSTDNTGDVIAAIESDKIRYFKKKNEERGVARNFGLANAIGQYVVFLDSDDRMKINHLDVLYQVVRTHQEDFIATKFEVVSPGKRAVLKDLQKLPAGYHTFQTFLKGNPLACCFTIRKDNESLIRFRPERKFAIMEDWIFLMENLANSRLLLVDEVTMELVDHENRSMRIDPSPVIMARKNALEYLQGSMKFTESDKKILLGSSFYFCGVHAFIAGNLREAYQYFLKSFRYSGLSINLVKMLLRTGLKKLVQR